MPDPSHVELSPSLQITNQIAEIRDWRGALYAGLRQIILDSVPGIVEDWKWGTGVWTQNGNVCSIGIFKDHVKLNFFHGAALEGFEKLFNAGLEAKKSRGIDFSENDKLDAPVLEELIRSAANFNGPAPK